MAKFHHVRGDELLYCAGDVANSWFILLSGSVLIESSMYLPFAWYDNFNIIYFLIFDYFYYKLLIKCLKLFLFNYYVYPICGFDLKVIVAKLFRVYWIV